MKASPGRGKLSPQVTDEGAGQQHFALNTPHPALRATFPPRGGEKAFAPDQAAKVDFHALRKVHLDKVSGVSYDLSRKVANGRLFSRQEVSHC